MLKCYYDEKLEAILILVESLL